MPATPKEQAQASARLKDPTHDAKQVKDPPNASPSESIETKKRKRRGRSEAKHLRMSSSMETISQASISSKASKKSHKRSSKKEPQRDNSAIKSAMSHGMQQPASPERTQRELSPKSSSDQKDVKDSTSTNSANPFEIPHPSEFIVPRGLELSLFNYSSDERETSYDPVFDYIPDVHNEISAMYTPVSRAVSQYDQCIRNQHGRKCETWLARQMYHELDNISRQIEDIMDKIRTMLEKRGARDNFDGLGGYYFEDEESPGVFKGGPENPLELSDGDDNALFVSSDERACSGELRGLFGDE
ncbi:hypothetical protein AAEP93_008142 [Penicillium crustosum]